MYFWLYVSCYYFYCSVLRYNGEHQVTAESRSEVIISILRVLFPVGLLVSLWTALTRGKCAKIDIGDTARVSQLLIASAMSVF